MNDFCRVVGGVAYLAPRYPIGLEKAPSQFINDYIGDSGRKFSLQLKNRAKAVLVPVSLNTSFNRRTY